MGEELWLVVGYDKPQYSNPVWFEADEKALVVDEVVIGVQVNGKMRAKLNLPNDSEEDVVKEAAWSDAKVKSHTDGKTIVKEIYVKNRIYNIVVR